MKTKTITKIFWANEESFNTLKGKEVCLVAKNEPDSGNDFMYEVQISWQEPQRANLSLKNVNLLVSAYGFNIDINLVKTEEGMNDHNSR